MSKIITIHCAGCSNTKQVVTQKDDHPDVIPGRISQWYCPTCEKKKAELEAQKKLEQEKKSREANQKAQEHEKKKQEWLQTPEGQAWQSEQTKLEQGVIAQAQKTLKESEEVRRKAREALKNQKDQAKINELETEIKKSETETKKIKDLIAENERKAKEKLSQLDRDLAQTENKTNSTSSISTSDNYNPVPQKKSKDTANLICDSCDIEIDGEYYYFPNPLKNKNTNICESCYPDFKLAIEASQKIFTGEITTEAEIDQLNFSDSDNKIVLKIFLKLKKGEKIDDTYIDQTALKPKDKQKLKDQLPQTKAFLEENEIISKQPQLSQVICSFCSQAIPFGVAYWKDRVNKTINCSNCYKCFTCSISLENKTVYFSNSKQLNCSDCHWKKLNKELQELKSSCWKCSKKILVGETYYYDKKYPNLKTCFNCHQLEVQQNKSLWKVPVFIGGIVFLLILIPWIIYRRYKNSKEQEN